MSFLTMIRKQGTVRGRRWTIRRDKDENITDIKMIFNPDIYATHHNAKKNVRRQSFNKNFRR